MNTISINYDIKDTDRNEDGSLKEDYINNCIANYGKKIIDLVLTGNDLTIRNIKGNNTGDEIDIEIETPITVTDENGKNTTAYKKETKKVFNITCFIQVINRNYIKDRESRRQIPKLKVDEKGKLIFEKNKYKKKDTIQKDIPNPTN